MILDRLFLADFLRKIGKLPAIIFTYMIVLIGWVLFRAETLGEAFSFIQKMFAFDFTSTGIFIPNKFYVFLVLGLVIAFSGYFSKVEERAEEWYENININMGTLYAKGLVTVGLGWWSLVEIFGSEFNPFIYFKF